MRGTVAFALIPICAYSNKLVGLTCVWSLMLIRQGAENGSSVVK